MTNNNKPELKTSRDNVALIIGGLFILALVFAAYNYFGNKENIDDAIDTNLLENIKDDTSEEGDLNGEGVSVKEGSAAEEKAAAEYNMGNTVNESTWVANDYNQGDIKGDTYTVTEGDTLWEIAEAVYGNGAEWTKILATNSSSVGFLPNGQQALIMPGQTLVL